MKKIITISIIIIAFVVAYWFFGPVSKISNFEDCVNAGYSILESHPRQCKTPDGRTFTEEITLDEEKDEITVLLTDLKSETGINFSDIQDVEFKWVVMVDPNIEDVNVQGKGFEVERISDEQYRSIESFFENNGFEADVYNAAAGTISGRTGYKLALTDGGHTVCHFSGGATGYKEATGRWIPSEPNLKDVEIKCGEIGEIDETANWQVYTNEKYGYSLKYPVNCLYGPLPGYCKQSPPEERPRECLCYFNAEDPNNVSLGTFTGTKSDLTGAEFVVFHSIYVDRYSPPAGTDLVDWVKENFPHYDDIPDKINMEIDGMPALRVYTPFSGMAWSQEDIYFIKNDKLLKIQMLNVDDEGNRALYDKILFTFRFSEVSKEEQTIEAKNNENFSIVLEANPTTGYEWQVDFDSTYIELVDRKHEVESDLVGAGGQETFNFLAKKSGTTEITFSYLRPWEEKKPIEKKVYEIIINNKTNI